MLNLMTPCLETTINTLPKPQLPLSRLKDSTFNVPLSQPSTFEFGKAGVAWEAPLILPKMSFHSQSRYTRAVPSWELQAPENGFSLAMLLMILENEVDIECVLTIRKIHKLGLASADLLREHFSQFGEVDRVMLLPSRPKSHSTLGTGAVKVRPASMAFVVMRSRQPAIISRLDEIHFVEGYPIQVQKFRRDPIQCDGSLEIPVDDYTWLDDGSTTADRSPPMMADTHRRSAHLAKLVN
jgi:hypothetical protein